LALEPNLAGPDQVRAALRDLRRALEDPDGRAILVLPSGVARTALLDPPADTAAQKYAQFRLSQGLPYPAAEALVDVVALGRGRFLGAAVRRSIVAEYEEAAAAAGWVQERLDLAPLAVGRLLRRPPERWRRGRDLGDVGLSLAAHKDGAVRSSAPAAGPRRRRTLRIQAEAERTGARRASAARRVVVGRDR
jgi:hypothetical protein